MVLLTISVAGLLSILAALQADPPAARLFHHRARLCFARWPRGDTSAFSAGFFLATRGDGFIFFAGLFRLSSFRLLATTARLR